MQDVKNNSKRGTIFVKKGAGLFVYQCHDMQHIIKLHTPKWVLTIACQLCFGHWDTVQNKTIVSIDF